MVESGIGGTAGQIPDLFAEDTVSSCVDLFCVNFSHVFFTTSLWILIEILSQRTATKLN